MSFWEFHVAMTPHTYYHTVDIDYDHHFDLYSTNFYHHFHAVVHNHLTAANHNLAYCIHRRRHHHVMDTQVYNYNKMGHNTCNKQKKRTKKNTQTYSQKKKRKTNKQSRKMLTMEK